MQNVYDFEIKNIIEWIAISIDKHQPLFLQLFVKNLIQPLINDRWFNKIGFYIHMQINIFLLNDLINDMEMPIIQ